MSLRQLFRLIESNGGIWKSYLTLYRTDTLKIGKLVGKDTFGNRYYENNYYFFGRNRWVIYADRFGMDYDGSQIHSDWFRWLHYITDIPPTLDKNKVTYEWILPHEENATGTRQQYFPYSTLKPKMTTWTHDSRGFICAKREKVVECKTP